MGGAGSDRAVSWRLWMTSQLIEMLRYVELIEEVDLTGDRLEEVEDEDEDASRL